MQRVLRVITLQEAIKKSSYMNSDESQADRTSS